MRFFLTLFCFSLVFVSFAQPAPRVLLRKLIFESQKVETLNVNKIANNRLLSNEGTRYSCPNCTKGCQLYSEVIKTGKKDYAGNEILYLKMYKDKSTKDTDYILLKPDFEPYPLKYEYFTISPENIRKSNSKEDVGKKSVNGKYSLVLTDSDGALFVNGDGQKFARRCTKYHNDERFYTYTYNYSEAPIEYFGCLSEEEGKTRNKTVYDRFIRDLSNLFEAVLKFNETKLNEAKEKNYNQLMSEFKDTDAFMFTLNQFDSLKVKFVKDTKGEVTEIVLHYPFMGNVYPDDDRFKLKITKDKSGFFKVNNKNDYISLRNTIVIPFDGRLLFCVAIENNNGIYNTNVSGNITELKVYHVLSTDITDTFPLHISGRDRLYNDDKMANFFRFLDDFNYGAGGKESFFKTWWKVKYFETTYKMSKDERRFSVFLLKYLNQLIETGKK